MKRAEFFGGIYPVCACVCLK